jgi:hypothetical protein
VGVRAGVRLRLPRLGPVKGPVTAWRLDEDAIERLHATWASYEGHFVHADAHRLRARLWESNPWAGQLLHRRQVKRRFAVTRPAVSLHAQVERMSLGTAGDGRPSLLLVQVWRFVEVHARAWRLGLRLRKVGRRFTVGAPWVAAARLIERGLKAAWRSAVSRRRRSRESWGFLRATFPT